MNEASKPRMVKLGDVAKWGSGGTPKRSVSAYFGKGVPWLSIADLNDGYVSEAKESLTYVGIEHSSAKVMPAGTLYVAMYGSIGKLGIGIRDFCTSQAIAFARPNNALVDTRYMFYYLLSQRRQLEFAGRGGTQSNISQKTLKSWPFPFRPLAEQRRIVAILDRADAIRVKRRQLLADYDELPRSLFAEMFGDMQATDRVENVIEKMRTGPFGSDLHHDEFVKSGISVLGLDNVVENEFRWVQRRYITPEKYEKLRRYTVYPGDVLVSIMGTAGRCVVVPHNIPTAINTKHICAITVNREMIEPIFLKAVFLWHKQARVHLLRSVKGSIMDGLNMGIIKKMPVILPPLSLQQEFASRVEAIASARRKVERALALDNELFASLQSRAFRGEL